MNRLIKDEKKQRKSQTAKPKANKVDLIVIKSSALSGAFFMRFPHQDTSNRLQNPPLHDF
jgi:hypothetical protein